MMLRTVPVGRFLFRWGTVTTGARVGCLKVRWLPRWRTSRQPSRSSNRINAEECNVDPSIDSCVLLHTMLGGAS